MEILNKILSLLEEKNIQQKDLSDYLGLSKSALTGWKNGNNKSYMKHLPKIAEFLGVSVDCLLGKMSSTSDYTYALYNEITHNLSQEQIEQIKNFADFLRNNKIGD